jgi:zinc transport system ATP-binding protein
MPVDPAETVVSLRSVSFSYGAETLFRDLTLDVRPGEYLGIIGPNGGGKSTLLKIMLGLLKSDGDIRLFGTPLRAFKDWSRIAYVSQKVTQIDPIFPLTVEEVVGMGRYGRRGRLRSLGQHDRQLVTKALQQVEVDDLRTRLIGDLSGGQQQRVFIARALAGEPDAIFLDEPTTGVDAQTQDQFYALLRELNRETHLTLVLASHDIAIVERDATTIAVMNRKLVFRGTPAELHANDGYAAILEESTHPHHH